jgi:hypothetical protein
VVAKLCPALCDSKEIFAAISSITTTAKIQIDVTLFMGTSKCGFGFALFTNAQTTQQTSNANGAG